MHSPLPLNTFNPIPTSLKQTRVQYFRLQKKFLNTMWTHPSRQQVPKTHSTLHNFLSQQRFLVLTASPFSLTHDPNTYRFMCNIKMWFPRHWRKKRQTTGGLSSQSLLLSVIRSRHLKSYTLRIFFIICFLNSTSNCYNEISASLEKRNQWLLLRPWKTRKKQNGLGTKTHALPPLSLCIEILFDTKWTQCIVLT